MKIRALDYDNLRQWYMLSNTPAYLYKHFAKEETLLQLALKSSVRELIGIFEEAIHDVPKELDDLITLYAVMIAICQKDAMDEYELAKDFLDKVRQCEIGWFEELVSICKSTRFPTFYAKGIQKATLVTPSRADTSTQTIIDQGKPLVTKEKRNG